MAHSRLNDIDLAEKALDLFRQQGYEGTSLNDLAAATGLEKASLYYRFPGGKRDMALAAAAYVGEWFEENIFLQLREPGRPIDRVRAITRKLRLFYGDGAKPCILDALSLRGTPPELAAALGGAYRAWIESFAVIARDSGMSSRAAEERGRQALIQIEGSLVLSRVTGDRKIFLHAIASLPELLTRP
ncbi:TetR/AcrR family transcriptional regulator [Occallatibacter savannae]|uniref:TetR/AcrR family transcriptional regulator n=1 Tax=Occallatibacter savannae TaxID=1002691 RepID=UPI000D699D96|nr:TetR/AcrR family transcriptional regulator [Occallatibacter savannae]